MLQRSCNQYSFRVSVCVVVRQSLQYLGVLPDRRASFKPTGLSSGNPDLANSQRHSDSLTCDTELAGRGLDKKDDDFAAGVEKELAKYRPDSERRYSNYNIYGVNSLALGVGVAAPSTTINIINMYSTYYYYDDDDDHYYYYHHHDDDADDDDDDDDDDYYCYQHWYCSCRCRCCCCCSRLNAGKAQNSGHGVGR